MINVPYTYEENENGWKSEDIVLSGDIQLLVALNSNGIVVIKKRNNAVAPNPKIYVSDYGSEFEIMLDGRSEDTDGMIIQVLTSAEPKHIKYANIQTQHTPGQESLGSTDR